ncbi:MAG: sulfatase-like hydrolase/transferase [Isosphaeraceae bacterium]|nr:sulfatase-like hydrolase/transferase [Isosphaeraceae bacterium]
MSRGPRAIVLAAVWFGLVAGLAELVVFAINREFLQRVVRDWLRTNRHAGWMIPAADLAIMAAIGLFFVSATRFFGRRVYPAAVGAFGALTALAPLLSAHRLHPVACLLLAGGVGARLVTINEARARRLQRVIHFSLPWLAILMVTYGTYEYNRVAGAERRALASLALAAPESPNVLLVVLDTVRADHMSAYGYDRQTTPRLDAIGQRGVQFDHAISTAPWTLPAHASLFTGRWHSELTANADRRLDPAFKPLAEFLRDHGYATAGFVGNTTNCNACYDFDRGFTRYEDFPEKMTVSLVETVNCSEIGRRLFQFAGLADRLKLDPDRVRKAAPAINRNLMSWLVQQEGRPFFAFVNYLDAHDPFILPEGVVPRYGPARRTAEQERVLRDWSHPGPAALPSEDAALVRDAYDDGIAYLDAQVGRLFDEMQVRGLLENTIVIVTADHGENLGEHDLYSHGRSLYQPEVRVPLLIFGPRSIPANRRLSATASLRDVPATVADLVGLGDSSPFPGRSLARHWQDQAAPEHTNDDPVLSEVFIRTTPGGEARLSPALRGPIRAVFLRGRKYIWYGDGTEEVFDLTVDPRETRNLAATTNLKGYREAIGITTATEPPLQWSQDDGVPQEDRAVSELGH